jgi:hypothetical protein
MTLFNLTLLQQADDAGKLLTYANNSANGYLVVFFMVALFFIMLMVLKRYDFPEAILTSSFICFILSLIFSYSGYMSIYYPFGFLAIAGFSAWVVFGFKDNYG